ncbi:hypothetical protein GE061_003695 [Apolygus lucorum]|uniref:Uncharacterized protein n=1 Tax=Apolygus lucorum TaxID=248454 RepID=A0A8S9X2S6_APOLU|nr:hypothetical protein GE061_003695 [Apolygus lucorum]
MYNSPEDNVHFKASGVRVIGICPGPTETNLMTCQQDKALVPDWSIAANMQFMENFQKPEVVAKAIVYMIQYATPGSLYVVEKGGLYNTNIPSIKKIRERVIYV